MLSLLVAALLTVRPPSDISVASAQGFPLMVHGPAGSDALLAKVRDAADRAWAAEIADGGWLAPPPDSEGPDTRFDLYVDATMSFPDAYTTGESGVPSTPWYDQTSYIVLPPDFPNDATLFSYVAHELNHASHYALDAAEDDTFYEHTAVMVEREVAGDFATWGIGVPDYQAHPERALTYIGTDYYEYGAGLWMIFLSQHLDAGGQGLAQRLWKDSQQPAATNRPHFLDSLGGILQERGSSRRTFFSTLSTWRYFTGSRDDQQHFVGAAAWGARSLVAVERRMPGASPRIDANLGAFGTKLVELVMPANASAVTMELDGTEAGGALVPLSSSGAALSTGVVSSAAGTTLRLELPPGTVMVLAALTSTPSSYDPNVMPFVMRAAGATLMVEHTDAGFWPLVDAGLDPGMPPVGCGCSGGAGELLFAALLLLWRRGRCQKKTVTPAPAGRGVGVRRLPS